MITFIYRKQSVTTFSIEKIFDSLHAVIVRSGFRVSRLELPYVSTGIVSVLRNAWAVARHRPLGVVHITGDVHYAAILLPFAKTIITVHDCVVLRRGTGFKRFVMRTLWFSIPLRMASVVVFISEQTREEVLSVLHIPAARVKVIPNFVDPAFVPFEREFSPVAPRILHVGTTTNKNLPRVMAALQGLPCVLVIVGSLSDAIKAQLQDRGLVYENHISISHAVMMNLYRDADLISFPSTYEGFGMPIIEGQSVGRPVLTSDREPMRGVAGAGALLVDPESVESIRDGFRRLIDDAALRARLVLAGRENCKRFSIDEIAARYAELYRTLLAA